MISLGIYPGMPTAESHVNESLLLLLLLTAESQILTRVCHQGPRLSEHLSSS